MTAVCPSGHTSQTADYCDQCGAPIASSTDEELDTSSSPVRAPCAACGAPRSGDDRFCEGCGHDFDGPPVQWQAVVAADRAQFDRLAPAGMAFPDVYVERAVALTGDAVRIGRGRAGAPDPPEIDLGLAPEDPGVSHAHAVLERQPDGRYAVRDCGSMNGTALGDDAAPIAADTPIVLADGDRIRVGVWTLLTIRAA